MGLFDKIFRFLKEPIHTHRTEVMTGGSTFTPFSGDTYRNDIYRIAVDAIARNTAKLKCNHIIYSKYENKREQGDYSLNRILNVRPNPYMTAYDLIYKLTTHYYLHNNAYAYLQKDDTGNLQAIYPLS